MNFSHPTTDRQNKTSRGFRNVKVKIIIFSKLRYALLEKTKYLLSAQRAISWKMKLVGGVDKGEQIETISIFSRFILRLHRVTLKTSPALSEVRFLFMNKIFLEKFTTGLASQHFKIFLGLPAQIAKPRKIIVRKIRPLPKT